LGAEAGREQVIAALARNFAKHFQFEMLRRETLSLTETFS
jgi:hypothetical protein